MQKKTIIRIVLLILIVIWVLMTFSFSNQGGTASSGLSRKIAGFFVHTEEQVSILEPYIRKIAHLSEYAIGGMLFLGMFLTYNFPDIKRMIFSIFLGIEYAAIDEIHQLFVEGRAGKFIDVVIDTIGISLGVCILMFIYIALKKYRKGDNIYDKFQEDNSRKDCKDS